MKATGIVRPVDQLGRIVVPKELRRILGVEEGKTSFEIFIDDNNNIVLRKYNPGCIGCGILENLKDVNGIKLCKNCIEKFNG